MDFLKYVVREDRRLELLLPKSVLKEILEELHRYQYESLTSQPTSDLVRITVEFTGLKTNLIEQGLPKREEAL